MRFPFSRRSSAAQLNRCDDDASRLLDMEKLLAKRERNRQASRKRMAKLRAKSKAGYAQPAAHHVVASGNGGHLSDRRIRELADLRSEQAYWKFSPADIAAGKLDAWLRDILRKEAPERIELEFQRVLKAR